jgi:hypothetical protein
VVLFVLGGLGLLLVAIGGVTHLQERRPPPSTRLLAISFSDFEARLRGLDRDLPGLIDVAASTADDAGRDAPLLVCDRAETAALLGANRAHLGGVRVLTARDVPADVEGMHIVVIHDCDPAGCAIAADLRDRGAEVRDAGITPGELAGQRLQLIEGAPARLPRDLAGHLDVAEADWLRSGRRLELATHTPEQVVVRVRAALSR